MNRLTVLSAIAFVAILFGACTDRLSIAKEASAQTRPAAGQESSAQSGGSDDESKTGATGEATGHQTLLNPEKHDIYPRPTNPSVAKGDDSESGSSDDQLSGVVNLNDATTEQLMRLHGIGPAIAERIENYRSKRRFEKPVHIKRVRGIGEVTFQNLKTYLVVKGETTIGK